MTRLAIEPLTGATQSLPRIKAAATPEPFTLRIRWDNGDESAVDVSGLIERFRVYEPLRAPPRSCSAKRMPATSEPTLYGRTTSTCRPTPSGASRKEQSGRTMSAEEFREWRERKALALHGAVRALGVSRRAVAYYEAGPIPRVVALAIRGLDAP